MFSRRDARTGGAFSNPPGGNGEHRSAPPLNRRGMQKALTGPVMYFMPPGMSHVLTVISTHYIA